MKLEEIQIGDILRVRSWEDIRENPPKIFHFADAMKYMCGEKFTISDIYDNELHSEEGLETMHGNYWYISADMLEPTLPPLSEIEADPSELIFN